VQFFGSMPKNVVRLPENTNTAASPSEKSADASPELTTQRISRYRLPADRAAIVRTTPPVVMTLMEAAAYLACSPRTLRDLVADRRVKSARVGAKIVIRRAWLDEFLGP
jgi:excisionase family DNA binding protein